MISFTSADPPVPISPSYPRASEATAAALEARGYALPWCAFRKSMAMATTPLFPALSRSPARKVFPPMWATASNAGPQCTGFDAARVYALRSSAGPPEP